MSEGDDFLRRAVQRRRTRPPANDTPRPEPNAQQERELRGALHGEPPPPPPAPKATLIPPGAVNVGPMPLGPEAELRAQLDRLAGRPLWEPGGS